MRISSSRLEPASRIRSHVLRRLAGTGSNRSTTEDYRTHLQCREPRHLLTAVSLSLSLIPSDPIKVQLIREPWRVIRSVGKRVEDKDRV